MGLKMFFGNFEINQKNQIKEGEENKKEKERTESGRKEHTGTRASKRRKKIQQWRVGRFESCFFLFLSFGFVVRTIRQICVAKLRLS